MLIKSNFRSIAPKNYQPYPALSTFLRSLVQPVELNAIKDELAEIAVKRFTNIPQPKKKKDIGNVSKKSSRSVSVEKKKANNGITVNAPKNCDQNNPLEPVENEHTKDNKAKEVNAPKNCDQNNPLKPVENEHTKDNKAKEEKVLKYITIDASKKHFQCPQCNREYFDRKSICRHMQFHEEKKYLCDLCPSKYTYRNQLEKHKRITHLKTEQVECDLCGKVFSTKWVLKVHFRYSHSKELRFHCEVCGEGFKENFMLKNHKIKDHEGVTFKCNECPKVFSLKSSLVYHVSTKHSKEVECIECKKLFPNRARYYLHKKTYHKIPVQTKIMCEICGKYISKRSLKQHMVVHSGERPFECEVCQKTFNKNQQLKIHMRIHTGERPYSCEVCSKTFNQINSLKIHKRIHTGERPYKCQICLKEFISRTVLNKHVCPFDPNDTTSSDEIN